MRRVRYAVASSLDGYVAGPNGETDWIPMDPDVDFGAIFSQFDTILAGRRTFEGMAKAGRAPMPGMEMLVFSRTLQQADHPGVTIVAGREREVIGRLKATSGKDIWLFGGGELFRSLAGQGLVDTVEVAVVPILLGSGVALVPRMEVPVRLSLTAHRIYEKSGIVSLEYAIGSPRLTNRK